MTVNPKHRYVIQNGPDGTSWVSLQPLLADLRELYDSTSDEYLKTHTATVINFVNSLILESQMQAWHADPKLSKDELKYSESLH